jgi:lysozyme
MRTGHDGVKLIKHFEGLHDGDLKEIGLQPKMCPSGVWTIGWGYALVNKKTGKFLKGQGDYKLIAEQYPEYLTITEDHANKLLDEVLKKYEGIVKKMVNAKMSQNQFDAVVSHTYNTGGSNGLFGLINQGKIKEAAIWIESKYTTGGGKVLPGLVRRRSAEAKLFLKT